MTEPATTGWSLVDVVHDGGEVRLRGVNPWLHEWISERTQIRVAHPSYPDQRHLLTIWTIAVADRALTFAAGELSPGVWAFFVPYDEFVPDEL